MYWRVIAFPLSNDSSNNDAYNYKKNNVFIEWRLYTLSKHKCGFNEAEDDVWFQQTYTLSIWIDEYSIIWSIVQVMYKIIEVSWNVWAAAADRNASKN